jgi:TIR domain
MNWIKDVNLLFGPLRELSRFRNEPAVGQILEEGSPELTQSEYDKWNGGTTYYTLSVNVPVATYAAIESQLEDVEKKLLERVKHLQRANTHDFISNVVIQPSFALGPRVLSGAEVPFWSPGHFRLFISHITVDKIRAAKVKNYLSDFAISCFVAHEDIEPTKEWHDEIEKALFSMDAMIAILSVDFPVSKWTDQEVGVALGRGIAVIPIRYGLDPYGLLGKYQGFQAVSRSVGQVGEGILGILLKHSKTRRRIVACLVEQLLASSSSFDAFLKLEALEKAEEIGQEELSRMRARGRKRNATA